MNQISALRLRRDQNLANRTFGACGVEDQNLVYSSPPECRRRDQNLVYTFIYRYLFGDQNLADRVSPEVNVRYKPRKSSHNRQLARSKPREWSGLLSAGPAHRRLKEIKTSYIRGQRLFFMVKMFLNQKNFKHIAYGFPEFHSPFFVIFWEQNRDIDLVNHPIPVRKRDQNLVSKDTALVNQRYNPRLYAIQTSQKRDINLVPGGVIPIKKNTKIEKVL